jgi:hypothetical protein
MWITFSLVVTFRSRHLFVQKSARRYTPHANRSCDTLDRSIAPCLLVLVWSSIKTEKFELVLEQFLLEDFQNPREWENKQKTCFGDTENLLEGIGRGRLHHPNPLLQYPLPAGCCRRGQRERSCWSVGTLLLLHIPLSFLSYTHLNNT